MAQEIIDGNLTIEIKKPMEEMRFEEHEYQDANGWCAVCGRSEGWWAHQVEEETSTQTPPVESDNESEPDEDLTTGPLELPAEETI